MKKRKKAKHKLLAVKVGQKEKRKMRHELMEIEDVSDEEIEHKRQQVVPKKRGPVFSFEEQKYIARIGEEYGVVLSHPILTDIARKVNIRIHDGKKVRNGSSLWWYIKRQQDKGNDILQGITIQPGSPKNSVGTRFGKKIPDELKNKPRGAVDKALKIPKPKLPPPPVRERPKASTNTQKIIENKIPNKTLEIIIRDPSTQKIEKVNVGKFSSIEELMFAIL